jgi:FkbM family methyltransferase
MTFISYAQNFEDVMLWRALRHIQNGCYIDIGANDPIVDSVSLAFYEHGWRGVHLEPTAQYANLLRQQRPDELVIQAAVSDSQKLLTFFEFPDTGLSTLDATIAAEHQQKGFRVLQTVTPTLTLDDVFAQNLRTDIHWLKIDVEGFEEAVLRGWNTSEVRPWIVVVESTLPMSTTPSHQHWEALVLQKGYQFVYFDGLNRYYVSDLHPELMAEPWIPPNVFDGFTIDGRASNVFSQDIQRRLQAATQSGQQSAVAELQASEQAKQTLLNQLAETRGQLEQQAASAREEHQLLSRQLKDARDELGQMVRLVSQREQEFAKRFKHFQADYQAVSQLLQQERDQAATQLQTLQQQLQTQQQLYQAELQRHRELEDKLGSLQQQLREKEQAFASQLLQLHQQKSGQQKVFQIREQSLRTELQRAREEIQRVGGQYQAELQDLRQTNETLNAETARYQQQYLELQHEFKLQLEQVTAELQQQIDAAQTIADEKAEALTAIQLDAERQQTIAVEQFNQLQQHSAEEYQRLQQESAEQLAQLEATKQQSALHYQAQIQHTVERYESELQQAKGLQLTLEQQLQTAEGQHAAELQQVLAELNSARHFIEQHQQHIAQLGTEREQLRHELSRVGRGYVALRADFKEKARRTTKFIKALQTRYQFKLEQAEGELSATRSLLVTLNQQVEDKNQQLSITQEQIRTQKSSFEVTILTLKEKVIETNDHLNAYTTETNIKLKNAESFVKQLETQLTEIKNAVRHADSVNQELNNLVEQKNIEISSYIELVKEKDFFASENIRRYDNMILTLEEKIKNYQGVLYQSRLLLDSFYGEVVKLRSGVLYRLIKSLYGLFSAHSLDGEKKLTSDYHANYYNLDAVLNSLSIDCYVEANMNRKNNGETLSSIKDIIELPADAFVEMMYFLLLGRQPDETGKNYYTGKIAAGISRTRLIYGLTKSTEWKENGKTIAGLEKLIREERLKSIPLLGRVLSKIFGWDSNSVVETQIRIISNKIDSYAANINSEFNALRKDVSNEINSIESRLRGCISHRIQESQPEEMLILDDSADSSISYWQPEKLKYSKETIEKYEELLDLMGTEGYKL